MQKHFISQAVNMLFNKVVHGADLTFRANLKWLLEELQFLALMHFYICF